MGKNNTKKMGEKELWDKFSGIQKDTPFCFGPYYSFQFRNTPRHILFTISRYKFAAKMIGEGNDVLELGCNEGLGSYYLSEFAHTVHGVDFDEGAIKWAKENLENKKLTFQCDNFLGKKYGEYDAVVAYDLIEHIYKKNEAEFMETIVNNLKQEGICLIGTPNITGDKYSNPKIKGAHVNLYSGGELVKFLKRFFHNVFLFGQNDELIHTGYTPMAQYLLAIACYKKDRAKW